MQTVKGLISLLLVAGVVFSAVLIVNKMTEPAYVTKEEKATLSETDKPAKSETSAVMGNTSSAAVHPKAPKTNL